MSLLGPVEATFQREFFDRYTRETYTKSFATPFSDGERIQMLVEHALVFCDPPKAAANAKPKRYHRTKEAIRKAKARAEGRVKPRSRKGRTSVEAQIAATEKSLATRRAQLSALKAKPDWARTDMAAVRRCEIGVEKTERSLATGKARRAAPQAAHAPVAHGLIRRARAECSVIPSHDYIDRWACAVDQLFGDPSTVKPLELEHIAYSHARAASAKLRAGLARSARARVLACVAKRLQAPRKGRLGDGCRRRVSAGAGTVPAPDDRRSIRSAPWARPNAAEVNRCDVSRVMPNGARSITGNDQSKPPPVVSGGEPRRWPLDRISHGKAVPE